VRIAIEGPEMKFVDQVLVAFNNYSMNLLFFKKILIYFLYEFHYNDFPPSNP